MLNCFLVPEVAGLPLAPAEDDVRPGDPVGKLMPLGDGPAGIGESRCGCLVAERLRPRRKHTQHMRAGVRMSQPGRQRKGRFGILDRAVQEPRNGFTPGKMSPGQRTLI